jgi:hypothetical protein
LIIEIAGTVRTILKTDILGVDLEIQILGNTVSIEGINDKTKSFLLAHETDFLNEKLGLI